MVNIGFYLMGEKGLACINALVEFIKDNQNCSIAFVISSRDKSVVNDYFEDIKKVATSNRIPFYERTTEPQDLSANLTFAIGWRWMIKDPENLIVFHDSLLPKYRGFNPLVTALIEGDKEIGVTAIRANKEFDRGNIIGVQKTTIKYPIKIKDAIEKVSTLYAELLVQTISSQSEDNRTETIQDETKASYSLWRDDEDYHIDWSLPSEKIIRMINAVGYPYNGAYTLVDGQKIIIDDVEPGENYNIINRTPGKLLMINENQPIVVCGTGTIRIVAARDENNEKYQFKKLRVRLK